MFVRWSWKHLTAQSLTDAALSTINNFLPPDEDAEHNNNLIVSHNYLITNNLVNEVRFGLSFWQFQVKFPMQGTSAISTLAWQDSIPATIPQLARSQSSISAMIPEAIPSSV